MEVFGSQQSLAKLDDAKQEAVLAGYAQFLNSLTFSFQLLVRVEPVDLSWYVAWVEERARALSPELVAIARDHARFVQSLGRQRTLFERRFYIIVPWSGTNDLGNTMKGFVTPAPVQTGSRGRAASDDQLIREETIVRQRGDRCEAIDRQLSRVGVRTKRLDDLGLSRLYQSSWAPEAAHTQRLQRELADYTGLVVGAESRFSRRRRVSDVGGVVDGEQHPLREPFAGRVVIPELRGGQPIWVVGRYPSDRKVHVKYLVLPGEKPVLGFERAAGRREVYLIEGVFDWLTGVSWHLPAFSTGGTDFPVDRLSWLARARIVFGVLDADRAGNEAAERFGVALGRRARPA